MKRNIFLLVSFFISITACTNGSSESLRTSETDSTKTEIPNKDIDTITYLWETTKGLNTTESVKYYDTKNIIFVSDINGKPTEKNGKGYISMLDADNGNIIYEKWITGLNAPKGMGIFDKKLFVADIDRLVIIDIEKKKIIDKIEVKGAGFLNDIDVDEEGNVYISDMTKHRIYVYSNGKITLFVDDEKLDYVNGLYYENGYLLAGTSNAVFKINLKEKEITKFFANTGSIDGLEACGNGKYVISDWSGKISIFDIKTKSIKTVFEDKNQNTADIEFRKDKNYLYVPTFFGNGVICYKIIL